MIKTNKNKQKRKLPSKAKLPQQINNLEKVNVDLFKTILLTYVSASERYALKIAMCFLFLVISYVQ
jgi:hypothetical protein